MTKEGKRQSHIKFKAFAKIRVEKKYERKKQKYMSKQVRKENMAARSQKIIFGKRERE